MSNLKTVGNKIIMKTFDTFHIKIDQGNYYLGLRKIFTSLRKNGICKCNQVEVLETRASWITQMGPESSDARL